MEEVEDDGQGRNRSRSRSGSGSGPDCAEAEMLLDISTVPFEIRLSSRRRTGLDELREQIASPAGGVPSMHYPRWPTIPLDRKLPGGTPAPPGSLVFARGRLGRKLHRRARTYSVRDPRHQRQVITGYDSLHDPHARGYLSKPSVRKLLLQQGLITPDGRVVCSLKQFNRYREYLSTIYNQCLEDYLHQSDKRSQLEHQCELELRSYAGMRRKQESKRKTILEKLRRKKIDDYKRLRVQRDRECRRQVEFERLRFLQNMSRAMKNTEDGLRRKLRVCRTAYRQKLVEEILFRALMEKDRHVRQRIHSQRVKDAEGQRLFLTEWAIAKCANQIQRIEADDLVERSLRQDLWERVSKRLARTDRRCQALIPFRECRGIYEARKRKKEAKAVERRLYLMKKYFYAWLNKVRYGRIDEAHRSLWDIGKELERDAVLMCNFCVETCPPNSAVDAIMKLHTSRHNFNSFSNRRDSRQPQPPPDPPKGPPIPAPASPPKLNAASPKAKQTLRTDCILCVPLSKRSKSAPYTGPTLYGVDRELHCTRYGVLRPFKQRSCDCYNAKGSAYSTLIKFWTEQQRDQLGNQSCGNCLEKIPVPKYGRRNAPLNFPPCPASQEGRGRPDRASPTNPPKRARTQPPITSCQCQPMSTSLKSRGESAAPARATERFAAESRSKSPHVDNGRETALHKRRASRYPRTGTTSTSSTAKPQWSDGGTQTGPVKMAATASGQTNGRNDQGVDGARDPAEHIDSDQEAPLLDAQGIASGADDGTELARVKTGMLGRRFKSKHNGRCDSKAEITWKPGGGGGGTGNPESPCTSSQSSKTGISGPSSQTAINVVGKSETKGVKQQSPNRDLTVVKKVGTETGKVIGKNPQTQSVAAGIDMRSISAQNSGVQLAARPQTTAAAGKGTRGSQVLLQDKSRGNDTLRSKDTQNRSAGKAGGTYRGDSELRPPHSAPAATNVETFLKIRDSSQSQQVNRETADTGVELNGGINQSLGPDGSTSTKSGPNRLEAAGRSVEVTSENQSSGPVEPTKSPKDQSSGPVEPLKSPMNQSSGPSQPTNTKSTNLDDKSVQVTSNTVAPTISNEIQTEVVGAPARETADKITSASASETNLYRTESAVRFAGESEVEGTRTQQTSGTPAEKGAVKKSTSLRDLSAQSLERSISVPASGMTLEVVDLDGTSPATPPPARVLQMIPTGLPPELERSVQNILFPGSQHLLDVRLPADFTSQRKPTVPPIRFQSEDSKRVIPRPDPSVTVMPRGVSRIHSKKSQRVIATPRVRSRIPKIPTSKPRVPVTPARSRHKPTAGEKSGGQIEPATMTSEEDGWDDEATGGGGWLQNSRPPPPSDLHEGSQKVDARIGSKIFPETSKSTLTPSQLPASMPARAVSTATVGTGASRGAGTSNTASATVTPSVAGAQIGTTPSLEQVFRDGIVQDAGTSPGPRPMPVHANTSGGDLRNSRDGATSTSNLDWGGPKDAGVGGSGIGTPRAAETSNFPGGSNQLKAVGTNTATDRAADAAIPGVKSDTRRDGGAPETAAVGSRDPEGSIPVAPALVDEGTSGPAVSTLRDGATSADNVAGLEHTGVGGASRDEDKSTSPWILGNQRDVETVTIPERTADGATTGDRLNNARDDGTSGGTVIGSRYGGTSPVLPATGHGGTSAASLRDLRDGVTSENGLDVPKDAGVGGGTIVTSRDANASTSATVLNQPKADETRENGTPGTTLGRSRDLGTTPVPVAVALVHEGTSGPDLRDGTTSASNLDRSKPTGVGDGTIGSSTNAAGISTSPADLRKLKDVETVTPLHHTTDGATPGTRLHSMRDSGTSGPAPVESHHVGTPSHTKLTTDASGTQTHPRGSINTGIPDADASKLRNALTNPNDSIGIESMVSSSGGAKDKGTDPHGSSKTQATSEIPAPPPLENTCLDGAVDSVVGDIIGSIAADLGLSSTDFNPCCIEPTEGKPTCPDPTKLESCCTACGGSSQFKTQSDPTPTLPTVNSGKVISYHSEDLAKHTGPRTRDTTSADASQTVAPFARTMSDSGNQTQPKVVGFQVSTVRQHPPGATDDVSTQNSVASDRSFDSHRLNVPSAISSQPVSGLGSGSAAGFPNTVGYQQFQTNPQINPDSAPQVPVARTGTVPPDTKKYSALSWPSELEEDSAAPEASFPGFSTAAAPYKQHLVDTTMTQIRNAMSYDPRAAAHAHSMQNIARARPRVRRTPDKSSKGISTTGGAQLSEEFRRAYKGCCTGGPFVAISDENLPLVREIYVDDRAVTPVSVELTGRALRRSTNTAGTRTMPHSSPGPFDGSAGASGLTDQRPSKHQKQMEFTGTAEDPTSSDVSLNTAFEGLDYAGAVGTSPERRDIQVGGSSPMNNAPSQIRQSHSALTQADVEQNCEHYHQIRNRIEYLRDRLEIFKKQLERSGICKRNVQDSSGSNRITESHQTCTIETALIGTTDGNTKISTSETMPGVPITKTQSLINLHASESYQNLSVGFQAKKKFRGSAGYLVESSDDDWGQIDYPFGISTRNQCDARAKGVDPDTVAIFRHQFARSSEPRDMRERIEKMKEQLRIARQNLRDKGISCDSTGIPAKLDSNTFRSSTFTNEILSYTDETERED